MHPRALSLLPQVGSYQIVGLSTLSRLTAGPRYLYYFLPAAPSALNASLLLLLYLQRRWSEQYAAARVAGSLSLRHRGVHAYG